jgi:hypothetical protein
MKILDLLSSLNIEKYFKENAIEAIINDNYSWGGVKCC